MHLFNPSILAEFWMPRAASTVSGQIDWLFYYILYICVFFFFLILALLVGFSWKYRYQPGKTPRPAPGHSTALELTWTFIPTVLVISIFYFGFKGYLNAAVAPPNTYRIIVLAQTWSYSFQYENGSIDDKLHIPSGRPVELLLDSKDVIHGFYVPEFRLKKDVVPGRYNHLWFQSDKAGNTYDVFCTQYCGQGHSTMRNTITVDSPTDFATYLGSIDFRHKPPTIVGQKLSQIYGCSGCHSVDGSRMTGPTWKNMWGHTVDFESGPSLTVDAPYVRESILYPAAKIVKGFSNVMPSFQGRASDEDINDLIAYMRSISDAGGNTAKPATAPAGKSASVPLTPAAGTTK